jgi:glutaminyl-tRNA synthetase
MYDFAHGQSDAIEGITHSLCTLEFEDHRPLYDWCSTTCRCPRARARYEFARLNLTYTVLSKRKLLRAGARGPRAAAGTTRACRRSRGCAAAATAGGDPRLLRADRRRQGQQHVDVVAMLEHCVREDLNRTAPRRMACCARSRW